MPGTRYPDLLIEENGTWITYEELLERRVRFGEPRSPQELTFKLFLRITTEWNRYRSLRKIWIGTLCSRALTQDEEKLLNRLQYMYALRRKYTRLYVYPDPRLSPRHHVYVTFGGKEITIEELDAVQVCFGGELVSYAEMQRIFSKPTHMMDRIKELLVTKNERGSLSSHEITELKRVLMLYKIWENYKNKQSIVPEH
jgi:hypothetical protein